MTAFPDIFQPIIRWNRWVVHDESDFYARGKKAGPEIRGMESSKKTGDFQEPLQEQKGEMNRSSPPKNGKFGRNLC